MRTSAEDKDDTQWRHNRQKAEVALAVRICRELIKTINNNQLMATGSGEGAQRLGKVITQGGAAGGGDVGGWQAVCEDKLSKHIMQHADVVVRARSQRNEVVYRLIERIFREQTGDQATLALAWVATDDQVAACRQERVNLRTHCSQFAGTANKGRQTAGNKAGMIVEQGTYVRGGWIAHGALRREDQRRREDQ